ncbi:stress-sensitive restriction system protein [Neisseria gonorrhoeae]|uniref:Stress-sensitive restriction system protein n=1 Tax=Neisseria gonorrhoeae TaxID=485 RepID=A0A378VZ67_NEIGO|nr:stress-sensitive restriction system protein [Neisseria gonorrhoeae]
MLRTYLNQLTPPELADSVKNTVDGFMENCHKPSRKSPKMFYYWAMFKVAKRHRFWVY